MLAVLGGRSCGPRLAGGQATSPATTVPLSITVSGPHFVNGAGHAIRLLGVNVTSSEYACVDGYG